MTTGSHPQSADGEVAAALKPLLRGWFHAVAAVAAVLFTVALGWRGRGDSGRLIAYLVFGLSTVLLYTVSALYHIGNWTPAVRRRLNMFDHANIFLQIAGTYTPLCVVVLSGRWGAILLAAVWIQAFTGMALTGATVRTPQWVMPAVCIAMGWMVILAFPALIHRLPAGAIATLVLGGVLYTAGAAVYALRRPDPFPRVFGFHEIFHLFVIAAGASFAAVTWFWVVPLP
jgi:hemolysin III